MKLLLLTILSLSALFAADPPKLPPEVAKIVEAREAEVAKATKAYDEAVVKLALARDAAVLKANAAGVKALGPVVTKLTKSGDLQGALAGQKVVEGWEPPKVGGGEKVGSVFKTDKEIMAFLTKNPKWVSPKGKEHAFDMKQMKVTSIEDGKVTYDANIRMENCVIWWGTCRFDFSKSDGKTVTFYWPGGETDILTAAE